MGRPELCVECKAKMRDWKRACLDVGCACFCHKERAAYDAGTRESPSTAYAAGLRKAAEMAEYSPRTLYATFSNGASAVGAAMDVLASSLRDLAASPAAPAGAPRGEPTCECYSDEIGFAALVDCPEHGVQKRAAAPPPPDEARQHEPWRAGAMMRQALMDLIYKHPDASKAVGGLDKRIQEAVEAWDAAVASPAGSPPGRTAERGRADAGRAAGKAAALRLRQRFGNDASESWLDKQMKDPVFARQFGYEECTDDLLAFFVELAGPPNSLNHDAAMVFHDAIKEDAHVGAAARVAKRGGK